MHVALMGYLVRMSFFSLVAKKNLPKRSQRVSALLFTNQNILQREKIKQKEKDNREIYDIHVVESHNKAFLMLHYIPLL